MERKINSRFRYGNLVLRVRTSPKPCVGCHFNHGPGKSDCLERDRAVTGMCSERSDGATVVFIRLGRIHERWYAVLLTWILRIAYFPVYIAGAAVKLTARILLSVGYMLTFDFRKGRAVLNSIFSRYNIHPNTKRHDNR